MDSDIYPSLAVLNLHRWPIMKALVSAVQPTKSFPKQKLLLIPTSADIICNAALLRTGLSTYYNSYEDLQSMNSLQKSTKEVPRS